MAITLTYEVIKQRIKYLYESHPNIHVNIKLPHSKATLVNAPATIEGTYPNIFVLVGNSKGYIERHTLKYSDVLIGNVEIIEFENDK